MSSVDGHHPSKINQLLRLWPVNVVAVQAWLQAQGVSRQLAAGYLRGGWIRKIDHGAYARMDGKVEWTGALFALQRQLGLQVHVGGKTALSRKGLAHFVALGSRPTVFLVGGKSTQLPRWFSRYDWGVRVQFVRSTLFEDGRHELGLTEDDCGGYSIMMASPERAILEVLDRVPQDESFEGAKLIMEGLTSLRPRLVQTLLERCTSVKAKRLFFFLAEECRHSWVQDLDKKRIALGKGKRVVVKGGRLDPVYQITVSQEAFVDVARRMQGFLNLRARSVALRLLLPKNAKVSEEKVKAVAYVEYCAGMLDRLDRLFKRLKIEERGSADFRKRLLKDWESTGTRNIQKQTLSVLVELVVADYVQQKWQGRKLNLAAWKGSDGRPDLQYFLEGHTRNVEVKYVPSSPEWEELRAAREDGQQVPLLRDQVNPHLNYYFYRLAEATLQLQRYPELSQEIWLVWSRNSAFRREFESCLKSPPGEWYSETEKQKGVFTHLGTKKKPEIRKSPPADWLKKVNRLVLATLREDWTLEDVKVVKGRE